MLFLPWVPSETPWGAVFGCFLPSSTAVPSIGSRLVIGHSCGPNTWSKPQQAWPEDALEMVANRFLEDVQLEDEIRLKCVKICKFFHERLARYMWRHQHIWRHFRSSVYARYLITFGMYFVVAITSLLRHISNLFSLSRIYWKKRVKK